MADLLGEVIPVLDINQQEEPGFEVITRVRGGGGDVTFSLSDALAKSSNSNLCRRGLCTSDRPGLEAPGGEELAGVSRRLEQAPGPGGQDDGRPATQASHL